MLINKLINKNDYAEFLGDCYPAYNKDGFLIGYFSWTNSPRLWEDIAMFFPFHAWKDTSEQTEEEK